MIVVLCVFAVLIELWLFLTAPGLKRARADSWRGTAFAHRGLHDGDAPENSLAAFRKAVENGYGIELDVRFSKDGHLIVFHDDELVRMTGHAAKPGDLTLAELKQLRLVGSNEPIPTFDEVLETVAGKVPLLVEVKSCKNIGELTARTAERLAQYGGAYVMESFNPFCLAHLKKHFPGVIRGQLVTTFKGYRKTRGGLGSMMLSGLLLNAVSRPDFVAYDKEMDRHAAIAVQRGLFHTPMAVWTLKKQEEVLHSGEMPIFEGFLLK